MKYVILFFALTLITSISFAKNQTIGTNGDLIHDIKQLDVFLINPIPHLDKGSKKYVELKVMNYGIHNCILSGKAWQENTAKFQAFLVKTDRLICGERSYPAHFYSRVISDKRLSLNSKTAFGSFAKSGLEVFLIKTKSSHKNSPQKVVEGLVFK
jgi:hypothetical protein